MIQYSNQIYCDTDDGWIQDYAFRNNVDLISDKKYICDDIISVVGEFGVSLEVYDKINSQPFTFGIYNIKLEVDKEKTYEVMNAGCAGYTILESTIHLLTKCVPYKPDYAILYQGINDAWQVQTVPGFLPDYTHARRTPNFPSQRKKGIFRFFPNIRLSFVYQSYSSSMLIGKNNFTCFIIIFILLSVKICRNLNESEHNSILGVIRVDSLFTVLRLR